VSISGNSVRIVTDASRAERRLGSVTIDARRPWDGRIALHRVFCALNAGREASGRFRRL